MLAGEAMKGIFSTTLMGPQPFLDEARIPLRMHTIILCHAEKALEISTSDFFATIKDYFT